MYDSEEKILRFNGDKNFRILMISDFHSGNHRKVFEDGSIDTRHIKLMDIMGEKL